MDTETRLMLIDIFDNETFLIYVLARYANWTFLNMMSVEFDTSSQVDETGGIRFKVDIEIFGSFDSADMCIFVHMQDNKIIESKISKRYGRNKHNTMIGDISDCLNGYYKWKLESA